MCLLFTSNHCIFVSFDKRTNIILYVFVTVLSCDVITNGTVIVPFDKSSGILCDVSPIVSSVSPIFILANSFSGTTLIVLESFVFPIDTMHVGTESLSANLSVISCPST